MNRDQIQAAFHRAARHSPLHQRFDLFRQLEGSYEDGPTYEWIGTAPGAVRFKEVENPYSLGVSPGTQSGEGTITLLADFTGESPFALRAEDGTWYAAKGWAGQQDTLRVGYRLTVVRWASDPPTNLVGVP